MSANPSRHYALRTMFFSYIGVFILSALKIMLIKYYELTIIPWYFIIITTLCIPVWLLIIPMIFSIIEKVTKKYISADENVVSVMLFIFIFIKTIECLYLIYSSITNLIIPLTFIFQGIAIMILSILTILLEIVFVKSFVKLGAS